jgi:hypothetical protein
MATSTIDESQRKAARVVGFTYLLTDATAVFAEFVVRSRLIVYANAAKTAANIMASERLFRLGIATELITFATVVVLIAALYVTLKPVNRSLALLAVFWRLVEASICVVMTLSSFNVLGLLSGATYLRTFETDRLQALTMLSITAHDNGYNVAMIFFGLGSTVFSYLWFKSRYIPRALAAWGVFSSLLVVASTLAFVVFPNLADILGPSFYMPILTFELGLGLWLLIKGLRPPVVAEPDKTST